MILRIFDAKFELRITEIHGHSRFAFFVWIERRDNGIIMFVKTKTVHGLQKCNV